MIVERLALGVYGANCYLIVCEDTKEAVIIDLGGEPEKIIKKSIAEGFSINCIILTHGHGDHIAGVPGLLKEINCPVYAHEKEAELLINPKLNLTSTMYMDKISIKPDKLLKENDVIEVGNLSIKVIYTPGHTMGGISLKVDNYIFTGDTLFQGSIGRTDLFGGSYDDIIDSINNKILIYDDETIILPGHGPATTIGAEKRTNPFVR